MTHRHAATPGTTAVPTAPATRGVPLPAAAAAAPGPGRGLVGRRAEWDHLTAALTAARAGRGGAVFLLGEPGAGRTRLAAEAVAAAGPDLVAVSGRAGSVGPAVPYRPLVEALLSLARTGLLPQRGEPVGYEAVLRRLLTGRTEPGAPADSPLVVAEAVLRLLTVVGRRRAVLLALDDLHDADPGTLTVVEYLLDHVARQPIVLLLTARREPCTATGLAARARQRGAAAVLDLAPLGHGDVRRLAATARRVAPCDVAPDVVRRLMELSAGIPFVVTELLDHDPDGTRPATPVPPAVADSVRSRTARLGPRAAEILGSAALFGPRFPLPVLRRAVGCDEAELTAALRAALDAHLIVPDRADPQWYAFRHRLVGLVLRDDTGPADRTRRARRAADALTALHPGLPGNWRARAADLHGQAGQTRQAVRLYRAAADRAAREGRPDEAAELLRRAHRATGPGTDPALRAAVLEQLLEAVAWTGRVGPLAALVSGEQAPDDDLPDTSRARIHARLAELALLSGVPHTAVRHLDAARWLLGGAPAVADSALVDLAAAHVELHRLGPGRLRTAEDLARRAVDAARRADLPAVACRGVLLLARLERRNRPSAASAHLAQARSLAREHRMPVLRVAADAQLARLASQDGSTDRPDAGPDRVEQLHAEARRMGAAPLAHATGLALALEEVRRGEFAAAGERLQACAADAEQLGLGRALARLTAAEAVRLAHQGRRAEMEQALRRLEPLADAAPGLRATAFGSARAICSLLEERPEDAERDFAQALAHDAENPSTVDFGRHGPVLLLGVLAGRLGRSHHTLAVESDGGDGWNRQFTGLADAVLLGREGDPEAATAAALAAREAAGPHPTARHLCARLVAREAHHNGWGTPVVWLRDAEDFFHGAGLGAVAGACRALLRESGASVRQRRAGTEHVPPGLRRCGITAREFEVARLLAERIANKDIAGLLHISPRTVEKHVASLLQKTGHPDRAAFARAARSGLLTGPPPSPVPPPGGPVTGGPVTGVGGTGVAGTAAPLAASRVAGVRVAGAPGVSVGMPSGPPAGPLASPVSGSAG